MTRTRAFLAVLAVVLLATTAPAYTGVQVYRFQTEEELRVLPEFRVALYENLMEQLSKKPKLGHIYREGELKAPAPGVITVRPTVTHFQKGSERLREVTTVGGWTNIKVHVRLENQATGALVAEKDLTGRVRFFGGNLRATQTLAKEITHLVEQNMAAQATAKGQD